MSSTVRLAPDTFYHVYNRGNNRENIFREPRNYAFFLERYFKHVSPVADTFAYCLMPNHFHILLRVHPEEAWPDRRPPERCLANLFSGYTKAMNSTYSRTGSLFQKPFQRVEIKTPRQLEHIVCYIHRNPQHHGFVDHFDDYSYSSYAALLSNAASRLCRGEVLDWYGGRQEFVRAHLSYDQDKRLDQ